LAGDLGACFVDCYHMARSNRIVEACLALLGLLAGVQIGSFKLVVVRNAGPADSEF
jgi:hypothetical protein